MLYSLRVFACADIKKTMKYVELEEAIAILKKGGVGIFPTDTAFALGCRIDDAKAVERLFGLKERSQYKASPVLVDSIEMAQEYLLPFSDKIVEKFFKQYWPGALTVILPSRVEKVSPVVTGGGRTLGVRMPNHDDALTMISDIGVPLLGTSANLAGGKTPFYLEDINLELGESVDFIMEGMCGEIEQVSTVVDVSQKPWRVVREGGVKIEL